MRKMGRDFDELEEIGPKSKAKRMSLKFVSQVMKKEVMPIGRTKESCNGRMVKRYKIGDKESNLKMPFGMFKDMK
jgi:hypothetical protein